MDMVADEMGATSAKNPPTASRHGTRATKSPASPRAETVPLRQKYMKNSEIEMPGGESWDEFLERFGTEVRAIARRRDKGEQVALIGHGHHILAAPAILSGTPADPKALDSLDEKYPPGSVYAMYDDGRVERLDNPKGETDEKAS